MARIVQKLEHGRRILSLTMIPGPKPDNFEDLGIPRHPPTSGKFTTDEPPYWDANSLAGSLRKLLSLVRNRAASGVAYRLLYREAGEQNEDGETVFPASQQLKFYSKAFDLPLKIYTDKSPIAAARAYAHEFATTWNTETFGEGYKINGYIYKIGVALMANKRPYREGPISSVEWARRYNKSRGKTPKPRKGRKGKR